MSAPWTYAFLDHTADAMADCRGVSFESLLWAATQALYDTALDVQREEASETQRIVVSSESREGLLVAWLQEINYRLDACGFVAVDAEWDWANEESVSAVLHGYRATPDERGAEIKAATFHNLNVSRSGKEWRAAVVFDL